MSMAKQERAETARDIASGSDRPDLLMAEYMRSKGVEVGAEIDKMWREGATKENQRALHKALAKHFDEELDRCIDKSIDRCIDKTIDRCIDKSIDRCIDKTIDRCIDKYVDRQIMVGNHRDLARTFARMSILQSC